MSSWADGAVNELIAASGGDHTTLASFEAAHDGETPTNGTTCQARIKGTPGDSGTIYWDLWQAGQGASTKIVIVAETGYECDGINDATGDDALITDAHNFYDRTNIIYVDIKNIEFTAIITCSANISGTTLNIAKCVFRDHSNHGVVLENANAILNIGGCVFKDVATSAWQTGVFIKAATSKVVNCTFDGINYYAVRDSGGTSTVKNCTEVNTTTGDFNGIDTETTNLTENDGDVVSTTGVDFTDVSSEDYRPVASGALDGAGTAESDSWFTTLCATDFAGTAWASPPSVGAFEVAGGSSAALAGTSAGAATTQAALSLLVSIEGTAAAVATTQAALSVVIGLSGSSAGVAVTSADLTTRIALSGTSAGIAATQAALSLQAALSGQSDGLATTQGSLSIKSGLAGTSAGAASAQGALSVKAGLSGASAGIATTAADLLALTYLSGIVAATANTQGSLSIKVGISGQADGTASTQAVLKINVALAGSALGFAVTSALLTVAGAIATISDADCEKIALFVYDKLVDEGIPALLDEIEDAAISNGLCCNTASANQQEMLKLIKRTFSDQRAFYNGNN